MIDGGIMKYIEVIDNMLNELSRFQEFFYSKFYDH